MGFTDAFGTGDPPPARWVPEPNIRGTWSILSTCLITLTLCLWTCLHLNLPEHGKASSQTWRKFRWLIIGLFAPEIVAFNAWLQRRAAKKLTKNMREALGLEAERSWHQEAKIAISKFFSRRSQSEDYDVGEAPHFKADEGRKWTTEHSYFALMGGFAFDTHKAEPQFLPCNYTQLCIRPEGLLLLAEHAPHLLPDIDVSVIMDKSKADRLGKALVCVQAFWFCVQTIARLGYSQPISFLEINTFCHSLCALLIYAIWWLKPLDINEPILLEGVEAWKWCAFMCVHSWFEPHSTYKILDWFLMPFSMTLDEAVGRLRNTEFLSGMKFGELRRFFTLRIIASSHCKQGLKEAIDRVPRAVIADIQDPETDLEEWEAPTDAAEKIVQNGDVLFGIEFRVGYVEAILRDKYLTDNEGLSTDKGNVVAVLSCTDCQRLKLFSQVVKQHGLSNERDYRSSLLSHRISDWATSQNMSVSTGDPNDWYFVIGMGVAGLCYGGLHLLAWNAALPAAWETYLWRISGITVASTAIFGLEWALGWFFRDSDATWLNVTWGLPLLLFVLLYIFARCFLVIESFVQLAYLPQGAYEQTRWPKYIPHIT